MTKPAKPKVVNLGMVIVEEIGDEFWVMFPDGSVEVKDSKAAAEKRIKGWAKEKCPKDAMGVNTIEWRSK